LTNEQHLAPAARAGDVWALDVVRRAAEPLAQTLVTLITGAGLEKVFLIGGFADSMRPVYVRTIRDLARKYCRYPVLEERIGNMIDAAEAGDETCLRGAALFAIRQPR
jgi:predicted NBD/HSP70 family sugar kinase